MTHPTTGAPTVFTNGSESTTHNVAMPATVAAGDLLVCAINVLEETGGASPNITTPAGWERPVGVYGDRGMGGNKARCAFYKRLADGTEGGTTVAFDTDGPTICVAHAYRIAAAEWSGELDDILGQATRDPSANDGPDAANFAPGLGVQDFLVLNFAFSFDDAAEATAAPANYTDLVSTELGGANAGLGVGSAQREITDDEEDAGAWTLSASQNWYSTITFVPPASGIPAAEVSASQPVPGFGQSAALVVTMRVAAGQSVPEFDQAVNLDVLGISTVAAAQAIPLFGGTAVLAVPDRMAGAQPVPGFGASAALAVLSGLSGEQNAPPFGTAGVVATVATISVAHGVPAFGQAASLGWVMPLPHQPVPHELVLHIHTFH
jgi:hypothetical protein